MIERTAQRTEQSEADQSKWSFAYPKDPEQYPGCLTRSLDAPVCVSK